MESPIITIIFKGENETCYTISKIQNIDKYQVEINHKQKLHMNTYSLKYYMDHQIFELSPKSVYFEVTAKEYPIIQFEWEKEEGENDDDFKKTLVEMLELQKGIYL